MVEGIGSNIMSLLKLLTPHQVNQLTDEAESRSGIKLGDEVAVALDMNSGSHPEFHKEEGHEAKILPFNQVLGEASKHSAQVATSEVSKLSHKQKEELLLRSLHIKKKKKRVVGGEDFEELDEEELAALKKKQKDEEVSSTVFLLQEKAKINRSRQKMQGQEAIRSYRSQAAVDTTQEDKEDLTQSTSTGILVNKRQY